MFSFSILYNYYIYIGPLICRMRMRKKEIVSPMLRDHNSQTAEVSAQFWLWLMRAQHCNHHNLRYQYYLDVTCCLIDTFNHHLPNLWWHIAIPTVFEIIPLCVWLIPPAIVYPTFGVTLQYHGLPVSNADSIWARASVWLILSIAQFLHWSAFYKSNI